MCKFCKNVKKKEDFNKEEPYLFFGRYRKEDAPAFHIDIPSDDGIRCSVENIHFCPYCGRKLERLHEN